MVTKDALSRRKLLKAMLELGLLTGPVGSLAGTMLQSNPARGQTASDRKYIYIQKFGAPSRWMFDLFLNPLNQTNFMANGMVGTLYAQGTNANANRYVDIRFVQRKIEAFDMWVPPLWTWDLPAPNGTRKMSSILAHMLQIRGIDTGNADHFFCSRLHYQPIGSVISGPVLASIGSSAPIPGVNVKGSGYKFASTDASTAVDLSDGGNLIEAILTPFLPGGTGTFRSRLAEVQTEIDEVQRAIDRAPEDKSYESFDKASQVAVRLIATDFPDHVAAWNTLRAKYEDLVRRAIRGNYPGLNDKPIGVAATSGRPLTYQLNARVVTAASMQALIGQETTVRELADCFALAEFVVVNGLSSSVCVGPGGETRSGLSELVNHSLSNHNLDDHSTGKMPSLYLTTLYHAATAACLLELVSVLKARNMFANTVIEMGSEFNRSARNSGTGSDHGFEATSKCMYSGAITRPIVIGDIKRSGSADAYAGTWGVSAPNKDFGTLGLSHYISCLATLLNVPSPTATTPSLIKRQSDGTIAAKLPTGKIVA
jgi:hypothetical protein